MPEEKKPGLYRKKYIELLQYSYVGLEMGFAVAIGAGVGFYLDIYVFDREYAPWITLFFVAMGIAAAAKAFYTAASELREKTRDRENGNRLR